MLKRISIHKLALTIFISVMLGECLSSQNIDKEVYKKFRQSDSSAVNTGAELVFYTDHTFVNYGIFKDQENQEVYVWYTYGRWQTKNGEYICKTYFESFNQRRIIDEIKAHYRSRSDFRLIDTYYEYVYERVLDYVIVIIKDKTYDATKKIEYKEEKATSL